MVTHEMKIRVWYKETDQMGFVHHSNYICYYEAARSSMFRAWGSSYADMEASGVMMPILNVESRYISPAFFEEELTVRVVIKEMPMARITFHYEVYNEAGKLINTGLTTLGFIKSDTKRPCRAPKEFLELLERHWIEE